MLTNSTTDLSSLVDNRKNEMEAQEPPRRTGPRKMYVAALAALMFPIALGMAAAYSATATDNMQKDESRVKPNADQVSWIGSLVAIGALFGGVASGPMCNFFGRKGALIVSSMPFLTGWLFIGYATNLWYIYIGRIFTGFCASLVCVVAPSYLIEISTPEVRGFLGACFQLFATLGSLLINVFGAFMNWNWQAIAAAITVTLALCVICLVPESPRWLVSKGKIKEAEEALHFLQGEHFNAESECISIKEDIAREPKGKIGIKDMLQPNVYKPTLFAMGLMFFQQFCGSNAVIFYLVKIFKQSGSSLGPIEATIVSNVALVLATAVSTILMDKVGRRILLIISGSGMGLSLCVLGSYQYLKIEHPTVSNYAWIPLATVIIYLTTLSIGYGPVAWLMTAEMSPIQYRGFIGGIAAVVCWGCVFIITKTFSDLEHAIHDYGAYWMYAAFCALSCVFAVILPETKGKTFEQIQDAFMKKKEELVKEKPLAIIAM